MECKAVEIKVNNHRKFYFMKGKPLIQNNVSDTQVHNYNFALILIVWICEQGFWSDSTSAKSLLVAVKVSDRQKRFLTVDTEAELVFLQFYILSLQMILVKIR